MYFGGFVPAGGAVRFKVPIGGEWVIDWIDTGASMGLLIKSLRVDEDELLVDGPEAALPVELFSDVTAVPALCFPRGAELVVLVGNPTAKETLMLARVHCWKDDP